MLILKSSYEYWKISVLGTKIYKLQLESALTNTVQQGIICMLVWEFPFLFRKEMFDSIASVSLSWVPFLLAVDFYTKRLSGFEMQNITIAVSKVFAILKPKGNPEQRAEHKQQP